MTVEFVLCVRDGGSQSPGFTWELKGTDAAKPCLVGRERFASRSDALRDAKAFLKRHLFSWKLADDALPHEATDADRHDARTDDTRHYPETPKPARRAGSALPDVVG